MKASVSCIVAKFSNSCALTLAYALRWSDWPLVLCVVFSVTGRITRELPCTMRSSNGHNACKHSRRHAAGWERERAVWKHAWVGFTCPKWVPAAWRQRLPIMMYPTRPKRHTLRWHIPSLVRQQRMVSFEPRTLGLADGRPADAKS